MIIESNLVLECHHITLQKTDKDGSRAEVIPSSQINAILYGEKGNKYSYTDGSKELKTGILRFKIERTRKP